MEELHSASEMVARSNLAHWTEGCLLAAIALLALAEVFAAASHPWVRLLWPLLVVGSGAFLPAFMLLHHGPAKVGFSWQLVYGDPQQRLHLAMALLLLAAGAAELLYRLRRVRSAVWQLAWPAVLVTIGVLFLVHQQHGAGEDMARAMLLHRLFGVALIAAAIARALQLLPTRAARWMAVTWPLLLLAAAGLLLAYREPPGAFRGHPAITGQPSPTPSQGGH